MPIENNESTETGNEFYIPIQNNAFDALIAKKVYALLFQFMQDGLNIKADTSNNLLSGWPIGDFVTTGSTISQEVIENKLLGGAHKMFIVGSIDTGTVTLTTLYHPGLGTLNYVPAHHAKILSPQFVLLFASECDEADKLEVWWSAGVNHAGGLGINGKYGKQITTELKFKVTGAVNSGTRQNARIPKSWHGDINTTESFSIDSFHP